MRQVLSRILPRVIKSDLFLRRAAMLAAGAASGQAITVLSTPLLTRMYSTAEFGSLQAFLSIFTLIAVVSSLRYETAVLLPEDEIPAACLAELACLVTAAVSLFVAILGFIWAAAGAPGASGLLAGAAIWILPVSVLGGGWNLVATHWCIRQGEYGKIARMKVAQGSAQSAIQIAFGIAHIGGAGLLIGHMVGRAAGTASIVRSAWRQRAGLFRSAASWTLIWRNAVRYKNFPLVASSATLLNTAALTLTPLLIGYYFGAHVLGLYALVDRSLTMSVALIGQSMSQVYMNSAARLAVSDPEALQALFLQTIKRLAILAALPCLFVMLAGPVLFSSIFGPAWGQAGIFARILAPCAYISFIVWPLMPTLVILERQSTQLQWDFTRLTLVAATFSVMHRAGCSAYSTVAANAITLTLMYVAHAVLSYRCIMRRKREIAPPLPQGVPA